MPIRASIYNNADIGNAFGNIAEMFAPPSAQDAAAYATAQAVRDKNDRLSQLFANPNDPNFDRLNIAAGNYAPTQSFYAQDQNNGTAQRGQDVSAATSITNNNADNRTSFLSSMFGKLAPGDVRPAVPADIAQGFGLPALSPAQGAPKPLTESEQQAIILGGLPANEQRAVALQGVPVENVVGPDGKPVIAARSDAVGKQPYFNRGAEAKPTNAVAVLPDGSQVPAVQSQDGTWHQAQTGEALPSTIRIYDLPKAQGTAEQVGLSKPTNNYIEQQLLDTAVAKDTAVKLRDMIAKAPASQGAVGFLRGTAQNVIETGGEIGHFFGGDVAKVMDQIKQGAADADLAGAFDPNIPAIDMMANLLAFQYAKTTTGQRLSNEMLKASRRALGLEGLDANQANSLARLDQAIKQISSQEDILRKARTGGVDALQSSVPPSAAPTAMNAGDGSDAPEGVDPEDWKYLTPDEKAAYQNGQ